MIKDEDAVDMLSTNMEKYFDRARGARIRKMFDYTINLEPNLTEEYVESRFPRSHRRKVLPDQMSSGI